MDDKRNLNGSISDTSTIRDMLQMIVRELERQDHCMAQFVPRTEIELTSGGAGKLADRLRIVELQVARLSERAGILGVIGGTISVAIIFGIKYLL